MRHTAIALLVAISFTTLAQAQKRPVAVAELQAFVGEYTLSDGRVITVNRQRHALVAKFDGVDAVPLVPTAAASFVARSGNLRLDFDQRRNGNVAGVTVDGDAAPSLPPARR